jgi:hypothetical protein
VASNRGFEACYEVSSHGRVRSLDRYVNHRSGKPVLVKSRVLRQTQRLDQNLKTGLPTVALRVAFSLDGVRYDLTVRRLVYAAFHSTELGEGVVINVDGDGYNNHKENLQLVTNQEKGARAVARDRHTLSLATLDRSTFPKTYGGYSRRKPVARYDQAGQLVEVYPSIADAVRATGWDEKAIISAAKGRWKQYHGFVWKYH